MLRMVGMVVWYHTIHTVRVGMDERPAQRLPPADTLCMYVECGQFSEVTGIVFGICKIQLMTEVTHRPIRQNLHLS